MSIRRSFVALCLIVTWSLHASPISSHPFLRSLPQIKAKAPENPNDGIILAVSQPAPTHAVNRLVARLNLSDILTVAAWHLISNSIPAPLAHIHLQTRFGTKTFPQQTPRHSMPEGPLIVIVFHGNRHNAGHNLQSDPAREFVNPYSYVGNNPVCYRDENGEFAVAGFLIGAGIDLGSQLWQTRDDPGPWYSHLDYGSIMISGAAGAMGAGWAKYVGKAGKAATWGTLKRIFHTCTGAISIAAGTQAVRNIRDEKEIGDGMGRSMALTAATVVGGEFISFGAQGLKRWAKSLEEIGNIEMTPMERFWKAAVVEAPPNSGAPDWWYGLGVNVERAAGPVTEVVVKIIDLEFLISPDDVLSREESGQP